MQTRYWQFYKNGLSILLMGIFLWGCSDNSQQKEEVVKTTEDLEWEKATVDSTLEQPLNERVETLLSTIQEYQKQAFESEKEKVNSSQSLIEEVEQSLTSYNQSSLDSVKRFLEQMKNSLYTEESMGDLEGMEAYDAYTADLIDAWKRFRENTEEFDNHARAVAFYQDIMRADKSDQGIRTNYNLLVHEFNKLLAEKEDEIEALGEQYKGLTPFTFFYGENPVVE